jgi:hypothetical protein
MYLQEAIEEFVELRVRYKYVKRFIRAEETITKTNKKLLTVMLSHIKHATLLYKQ